MQDELPDLIEQGEAKIEAYIADHVRGDECECMVCHKWVPIASAQAISADPYCLPACPECVKKVLALSKVNVSAEAGTK